MTWTRLTTEAARAAGCYLGTYRLRNDQDEIVYIGYAGSRAAFGLRGLLEEHLRSATEPLWFTTDVTSSYLTRYQELLMLHRFEHGGLPRYNRENIDRIGRLTPR
jgi:hypothetical protein